MPPVWRVALAILVICLCASVAIAVVRLTTTPTEILGDAPHGFGARALQR